MQNLLKFALLTLISLTSLNASYPYNLDFPSFSNINEKLGSTFFYYDDRKNSIKVNPQFINDKYFRVGDDIYYYYLTSLIIFPLVDSFNMSPGFYMNGISILYYYDSSFEKKTFLCEYNSGGYPRNCRNIVPNSSSDEKLFDFSFYSTFYYEKKTTCQPDENFNTETKECQKCPEGHSWDKENNKCFPDCSDINKNKWGFTDGSCIDCSSSKLKVDVGHCYCNSRGTSFDPHKILPILSNGLYGATCVDGEYFEFKDPNTPDIPKPDNNNTTPNNPGGGNTTPGGPGGGNGGPGGGSGGPGGGNGNDGNNNGPGGGGPSGDSEFCKKNPNDPKCKGPGGDNEFCKKNPKDPRCKGPGGGGPSGNFDPDDNKDKDAKFNPKDFDYSDLEKDADDFRKKIIDHYYDTYSRFDNFRRGYDQLIDNIKGKGLSSFKDKGSVNSCPRTFKIDVSSYSVQNVEIDICKEFSKLKGAFYHIFYLFFFVYFLILTIKTTKPLIVNPFRSI